MDQTIYRNLQNIHLMKNPPQIASKMVPKSIKNWWKIDLWKRFPKSRQNNKKEQLL